VLPVIDDDVTEDGYVFLVMPLLRGETLRARWERSGRRLPLEEVLVVAHRVLEALAAAHAAKIVHRDVKPDNIFVTRAGEVRVLDFGVARFFETNDPSATRSGRAVGTPAFMAPEQALGRMRDVDGKTDLWALGATMFSLLSGRFVHEAENAGEVLAMAATRPARSLREVAPEVPGVICDVIDRALSFRREDRWPDAATMDEALRSACRAALDKTMEELSLPTLPAAADDVADQGAFAPDAAPGPASEGPRTPTERLRIATTRTATNARRQAAVAQDGEPLHRFRRFARSGLGIAIGVVAVVMFAVGALRRSRELTAAPVLSPAPPRERADASFVSAGHDFFEAGQRAMYGASVDLAREFFEKAVVADPTLAKAHLRSVMLSLFTDDSARAHFAAANRFRASLSDEEQTLLDAVAPLAAAEPNPNAALERLESAAQKYPKSIDIVLAFSLRHFALRRFSEALPDADHLLEIDRDLAAAWYLRGAALLELSRDDEARSAYSKCVEVSPRAQSCLRDLNDLDGMDGRCREAEQASRALIADEPAQPEWYFRLASALYGEHQDLLEARAALLQQWKLTPEASRARETLSGELNLAVLRGDFDAATKYAAAWEQDVSGATDEMEHAIAFRDRMLLALEVGDASSLRVAADTFLAQWSAWTRSSVTDFRIYAYDFLYESGELSHDAFAKRRDEWAHDIEERGIANDEWVLGWATPVRTLVDAQEALRALHSQAAFGGSQRRGADNELAIGRVYLLAGQMNEAEAHLSRGARSCTALSSPIYNTQCHVELGTVLARRGATTAACAEYATVLQRWGRSSASKTAKEARSLSEEAGCRSRSGDASITQ
jgi:serine/threonine-protein kinase